ncbi:MULTISPECIES: hypothetical protein [Bacteroides]|jgi:hypothetical protein|uniref:Uncharacterized protein n=1 Tax=Bacteroides difficilis TaxID=2763021 RepID=A0ABR7CDL9_9BACE|nr:MULTISPECIES: hypothetical protein [Bacteroides]MBC5605889.1 hypothetical protein [Bacteroides difficilis]
MTSKKIKELKKGEYFRLKDCDSSPVWIKGEYVRSDKKYSTYKFEDVNHERLFSPDKIVFTDFEF